MVMVMKIIKRRMVSFRKAPAAARDFAEAVDASNYRTSLTPGRWPHSRDMSQEYPLTGRRNAETRRTLQPVMQCWPPYIRIKEPKLHACILCEASLFWLSSFLASTHENLFPLNHLEYHSNSPHTSPHNKVLGNSKAPNIKLTPQGHESESLGYPWICKSEEKPPEDSGVSIPFHSSFGKDSFTLNT